jgi:hypothetical protein
VGVVGETQLCILAAGKDPDGWSVVMNGIRRGSQENGSPCLLWLPKRALQRSVRSFNRRFDEARRGFDLRFALVHSAYGLRWLARDPNHARTRGFAATER